VVLDETGKSDFQIMQNYQKTKKGNIYYYLFDLLYLDGKDLRDCPLFERKEKLQTLLQLYSLNSIRCSDPIEKKGISFFKKAQKYCLEGILAKKKTSIYRSIRSKEWLKIKTRYPQEAIIGGYTKPRGSRKYFGALLLGIYDRKKFVYIGYVGTGFTESLLKETYEKMLPLVVVESPFDKKVMPNMPATWVKPLLISEIVFSE